MQSPDDEIDHEEEENPAEQNGFAVPVNSLMLIAITKPSQNEVPLCQCLPDCSSTIG